MAVTAMESNWTPLDTMWFRLIESTKKARYMYQISSQSEEYCRKYRGGVGLTPSPLCLRATFFIGFKS